MVAGVAGAVIGRRVDLVSTQGLMLSAAHVGYVSFIREGTPDALSHIRRSDLYLPALFGIVGAGEMAVQGYRPLAVSIGTYLLACLVLCARRRIPLATPAFTTAAFALAAAVGFDVSQPASWILPPA